MKLNELISEYIDEDIVVEVYLNFKSNFRGTITKPKGLDKIKYSFDADDYSEIGNCEVVSIGCHADMYDGPFIEVVVKE